VSDVDRLKLAARAFAAKAREIDHANRAGQDRDLARRLLVEYNDAQNRLLGCAIAYDLSADDGSVST